MMSELNIQFNEIDFSKFSKEICNIPLPENQVELLLTESCHIDHEGYDLNSIEQAYYNINNISVSYDSTWYKDGGKTSGTNAVILPWAIQKPTVTNVLIDHSHIVFRYPITGAAKQQIIQYASIRPELLKLISVNFKCGVDLCIDYIDSERNLVEPIVHIEWDFSNITELQNSMEQIKKIVDETNWTDAISIIRKFNKLAKQNKCSAFDQADTRAMMIFAEKSYKLIPSI